MNNSSLFWSISGVLVIFVIASLAVGGLESGLVRSPFKGNPVLQDQETPTTKIQDGQTSENNESTKSGEEIVAEVLSEGTGEPIQKLPEISDVNNLNFEADGITPLPADNQTVNWNKDTLRTSELATATSLEPKLAPEISPELLRKAGFSEFIIKARPFDGKLLKLIDLSEINTSQISEYEINLGAGDLMVINKIETRNEDLNKEFFDFLKNKFGSIIGAKINQTNQFGLASFYINFEIPQKSIFLVVKYQTSVYALSYPRPDSLNGQMEADQGFQSEVGKLILELS